MVTTIKDFKVCFPVTGAIHAKYPPDNRSITVLNAQLLSQALNYLYRATLLHGHSHGRGWLLAV